MITVAGVEVEARHWIGGEPTPSSDGRTFSVFSPIDGAALGEVSAGSASEIDRAVAAARAAFPAWAALGPTGRGEILDRFAQAILAHMHDVLFEEEVSRPLNR